jgi:hypothetical protein
MRRHLLVALALLPALARPAAAAEFVPGWSTDIGWDSNVFRTPDEQDLVIRTLDSEARPILVPGPEKESDFSLRAGPDVKLRQPKGDLTYDLNYRLGYEHHFNVSDVDDFEHFLTAHGNWQATRTTSVSLSENFASTSGVAAIIDFADPLPDLQIDPTVNVTGQLQRVTTNDATATITQRLAPRWNLQGSFSGSLFDYEQETAADSRAFVGSTQVTYSLSPRTLVGIGAAVQRQTFDPGRNTDFYQGFGVFNHSLSPTWTFSIRMGPAWSAPEAVSGGEGSVNILAPAVFPGALRPIPVDVSTCPRNSSGEPVVPLLPQSERDLCRAALGVSTLRVASVPFESEEAEGSLTYFGRVSMDKSWRNWTASVAYDRRASTSSGIGTSTTVDSLSLRVAWTPSRQWNVNFTASASRQSLTSEVLQQNLVLGNCFVIVFLGGNAIRVPVSCDTPNALGDPLRIEPGDKISDPADVTTYRIQLGGERRFGRNLSVRASASYWTQESGAGQVRFVSGAATGEVSETSLFLDQERSRHAFRINVGFTWTFDPIVL